jgi:hypothetical protein
LPWLYFPDFFSAKKEKKNLANGADQLKLAVSAAIALWRL